MVIPVGTQRAALLGTARRQAAVDSILGAGGLDYAYWDATFRDGLYSEPIGPTVIGANGDAPGLWIDAGQRKRRPLASALAAAMQLVANPDFSSGLAGWSTPNGSSALLGDGWVRVTSTDGTTSGRLRQIIPTEVGALYAVTFQSRSGTGGRPILRVQTSDNPATAVLSRMAAADGTETVFFVSTSATLMRVLLYVPTSTVGAYADFRSCEVRKVPGHFALQPTASYKPNLQDAGMAFDGGDDRMSSDWLCGAAANCAIIDMTVPASLAAPQTPFGVHDGNGRYRLDINSTTGYLSSAVGNDIVKGAISSDVRGRRAIAAVTCNGAAGRVMLDALDSGEFVQSGAPSTVGALAIGAYSAGAGFGNFFGGSIRRLAFGRTYLSPDQFQAIRAEWLKS